MRENPALKSATCVNKFTNVAVKVFSTVLILSSTLNVSVVAQNRKGQIEINTLLNPWALFLSKSYCIQYE
ncbi:MAG: hypothetical protein ACI9V1_000454 [Spirosomataceae bacterium]|jgi:hypothetical protein